MGPIKGIAGSSQYSIYGWAKWGQIQRQKPWHILFRYTNYAEEKYKNTGFGERDLSCFIGKRHLHFATYDFQLNGRKNWNLAKNIAYKQQDINEWFFFYMGYSHN